jgi:hypothetical protein
MTRPNYPEWTPADRKWLLECLALELTVTQISAFCGRTEKGVQIMIARLTDESKRRTLLAARAAKKAAQPPPPPARDWIFIDLRARGAQARRLLAAGYRTCDVARALGISPARACQLRKKMGA